METPIYDYVTAYAVSNTARLHMPGHKGRPFLGCEPFDITEISGADALYEAGGIIAKSEEHARALFGTQKTLYSTEGSSQCIRAMLFLVAAHKGQSGRIRVLAGRNAHKSFLYAAALLDLDVTWLWPKAMPSLLGCPLSADDVEAAFLSDSLPDAVYLTNPDYLGGQVDIAAIAAVCHRYGVFLLVDNAHGAYLHFLDSPLHPMDLGADLCCDSAHKTLPVLTGGAYLHIAASVPTSIADRAKEAMAIFGSTSPSYLILSSLDLCNAFLSGNFRSRLANTIAHLELTRTALRQNGWSVPDTDPLKLTLHVPACTTGTAFAHRLHHAGMEVEYADRDALVMMLTPENDLQTLTDLVTLLGQNRLGAPATRSILPWQSRMVTTIREAIFADRELVPASQSSGRVCAAPTVGCPPAIPIAVSGERITPAMVDLFLGYGVDTVAVVKE